MATQDIGKFVAKVPGTVTTKQYQVELNKETGSTVTYDVTGLGQKDAVLRNDVQVVNGERIYQTQFVPDEDGNLPDGSTGKFLSETVAKQSDQARAAFYQKNAPQSGKNLGIPGVKNTEATPESTGLTLGDSKTGAENLSGDLNQAIQSGKIRENYGNYKYPINFPEKQDAIKFTMFRYRPRSFDVKSIEQNLRVFGDRPKDTAKDRFGSVTLPISSSITDTNSVEWGSAEMNALEALAASAAYTTIRSGPAGFGEAIDNIAKGLEGSGGALKTAAAAYFAGQAAGGNKGFVSRITGGILNPNLELLFNGPQLRTFSFSFTMSPREKDEANQIKKIIRFFKQGMSVKRASTNLFLTAPNIFEISYIYGESGKDHPWINKIKTCALTNCQVNYTPAGNYATFYDGPMTAYEITLSFSELDPIFEDDYDTADASIGGGLDSSIGY